MATSTQLQRKIFTRWVNQKVSLSRGIVVNDVVTDIGDGVLLINLLEVLGEREFPDKYNKAPKLRVHKIDNLNKALGFVWSSGVDMKVKASAEDLADGVEIQILGLIWGIMLKFLKFGDDTDSLNAKDALLLWVQNKTAGYPHLRVENFKKSFKDGLALCAIIHKHRPSLIDYDSLNPADGVANIKTAMNAAEKYFALEQYLTPEEYLRLDENSTVVYVAEYYYGIAEQRKVDLAVRRVHKLIALTKENDRMRAEHNAGALRLKDHIKRVEKILEDRSIDNTMEGAKRRIAEFYDYKTNDKGVILADQLKLEALFNNLSMRLAHHKRPEYVPPEGCTLKDVENAIAHLEECEQERKIALHAELNRQIKLVRWDKQHDEQAVKLNSWINEKSEYLSTKEVSTTVGAAQYQLARLDAYDQEATKLVAGPVATHRKLGDDLESEKYENTGSVRAREAEIAAGVARLGQLSSQKRPVLDDDLAREQFRSRLAMLNHNHATQSTALDAWISEKIVYLNTVEDIDSIEEAETQLNLLQEFQKERVSVHDTRFTVLRGLGREILDARYSTQYSSAQWERPAEITDREGALEVKLNTNLVQLSDAKRVRLEADLAREKKKESLRVQFAGLAVDFTRWTKDSSEAAAASIFGFDLPEVEAYQATLNQNDAEVNAEADSRQAAYTAAFNEAVSLGVTENVYTTSTLESLADARAALSAALGERRGRYEVELRRQQENDALCKRFADLADPLAKWISEQKDAITKSKDDLESQLNNVEGRIASIGSDGATLAQIQSLQDEIDAKGIITNRHTLLTAKDVHSQFSQWENFLNQKKVMLEEAIAHHKLRGITPEQYAEIEENFKQFDKSGNGALEQKELKACLYSLGEERGAKEISSIVQQYGKDGKIDYPGYREFMITVLGDTDTQDEIVDAFKLINRGDVLTDERMDFTAVLPEDQDYLRTTAPAVEGGWNYHAWTADVFSR